MPAWVKLKDGMDYRLGADVLLGSGAILRVSDAELEAFGDKFEVVDAPVEEPEGELSGVGEMPTESPLAPDAIAVIDATDAAHNMAGDHDVNLSDIEGSGTDGRILISDVRAVIAAKE